MILEYFHRPEIDFPHGIRIVWEDGPNLYYDWYVIITIGESLHYVEPKNNLKEWLKQKDYKIIIPNRNINTLNWPVGEYPIYGNILKDNVCFVFKDIDTALAFKLKFDFG